MGNFLVQIIKCHATTSQSFGGIIHTEQKWTVSPVVTHTEILNPDILKKKLVTIWPFSLYFLETSSQFYFNLYWLDSQASPLHDTLILSLRPVEGEHIILYSVRKVQVLMLGSIPACSLGSEINSLWPWE